ncbi:MAG: hypothetical protein H0X24_07145 [Ktedonobacterales bacterium]|nr:hypothetical protein [Ktedonobacterales bacterium]
MISLTELHPIVVHFPIALLTLSVVMDGLAALLRRWNLADMATWLLGFGVVGALVAGLTGNFSEHSAHTALAGGIINQHSHFAFATGAIFAALFAVRIVALLPRVLLGLRSIAPALANGADKQLRGIIPFVFQAPPTRLLIGLYLLASVGGLVLLTLTGYYGGLMVYHYGVGTPAHP